MTTESNSYNLYVVKIEFAVVLHTKLRQKRVLVTHKEDLNAHDVSLMLTSYMMTGMSKS